MNNLNSILLEGTTVSVGPLLGPIAGTAIVFFIESMWRQEAHQFEIHATGKLAETMAATLRSDQSVRVVGSVRQQKSGAEKEKGGIFIMAEHIEFRPTK